MPRSAVAVLVRIRDTFVGSPLLVRGDVRNGVGKGNKLTGRKGASGHRWGALE